MSKGSYISKREAVMLQGIAVSLMVIHHLFGFPERINVAYCHLLDFKFFHFETVLSYFGRICIVLFAFISGYGIMKKFEGGGTYFSGIEVLKKGYDIILYQIKKIYVIYWMIFLAFIPYGVMTRIYPFDMKEFIKNLLGISATYNREWWYFGSYVRVILCLPVFFAIVWRLEKLMKNVKFGAFAIWSGCLCILACHAQENAFMQLFYCFATGAMCVHFSLFEYISNWIKNKTLGNVIICISFGCAVVIRIYVTQKADYLLAPIFVFGFATWLKSFYCPLKIKTVFLIVGKYSTYIWLTHTFFAYYY